MAPYSDDKLALALVHDVGVLLEGAPLDGATALREKLFLAEVLLGGDATSEDRSRVYDLVHPSVRSYFLS